MNQPLGYSIGHNLEMKETIMALRGIISEDLGNVVEALGSIMIALATQNKDLNENFSVSSCLCVHSIRKINSKQR